jgi:hypothetical protein
LLVSVSNVALRMSSVRGPQSLWNSRRNIATS